ncbi:Aliphatic sulfonates import ATP-binding protein SsuB [Hartmannibacter diazotrophicus]|uniref:Aliphatic sulfonates import ATP-binding protein SsuB n=1 Tax=Hartmannibacter diazotrophicus TaxID=1482074 RepID=A0A2C9D2N1_9HYPH|nr:ABC transporter ATP-binding protein [Hartmannibacter diazotrophicus]SON54051.1 Aliphatic sulfonates import ATP-binding protein SsuB [Hartmannibacter diazotrophicus]
MTLSDRKLAVSELTKSFGGLNVLSGITADVMNGEFISIVGPSGCGKTTFLRIVGGLETASSGAARLDGKVISGPGMDRGFVFQQDSLLPWRTVEENVQIGPELNGTLDDAARQRIAELLKLVGLDGFAGFPPRNLSGGMRQRANLARALAVDPELLLMDEPFSALDAQTREIMQTELLRVWEAGAKTVLFVTHQIDEAVYLSDRVFVFARRPGRINKIVDVDLPRPRPLSIKRTPEFARYVDEIWKLIEEDVRVSVLQEHVG